MKADRFFPFGVGTVVVVFLVLTGSPWGASACPLQRATRSITDPDFPIAELFFSTYDEMHADVAYNPVADQYLVVFDVIDDGSTVHDVQMITVSGDGSTISNRSSVPCTTVHDDVHPAVAYNPFHNDFMVVWERGAAGSKDIYGRILDGTGCTEIAIATASDDQRNPDVAYGALGSYRRYLVVWEDDWQSLPAPPDTRGRCVSTDGNLLGTELAIGVSSGLQQYPTAVSSEYDGHWLVAWKDSRDGYNVYGGEVTPAENCAVVGSDFAIGPGTGEVGVPQVAWGEVDAPGAGEFLVVWDQLGNVLGRRVSADTFAPVGSAIPVVEDRVVQDANVAYASQPNEWWVVWEDG